MSETRDFICEIPADQAMNAQDQARFDELQRLIRDYIIAKATFEAVNGYNCALELAFGTRSTASQEAAYDLAEDNHEAASRAVLSFKWVECPIVQRAHHDFMAKHPELIDLACMYATAHFDDRAKARQTGGKA